MELTERERGGVVKLADVLREVERSANMSGMDTADALFTWRPLLAALRNLPRSTEGEGEVEPVLPVDLRVGNTRFRKGVKISTAQIGINRLFEQYLAVTHDMPMSEVIARISALHPASEE